MEAYGDFAKVYDIFMDEVPYDKWCDFIVSTFEKYNVPKELILDLGCGTGNLTRMLANRGYSMIGVDSSWEMLSIAKEYEDDLEKDFNDWEEAFDELEGKALIGDEFITDGELTYDENSSNILYLLQDMREFELYGTVRAVVSVCDSINYLVTDEDVLECFKLVNNYLDPDGIFIFDFNTKYKYSEVIGDSIIAENREECSFIWENFYDEATRINEYDLTIFTKTEDGLYEKSVETHYQKGYTLDEMTALVKAAGLEFVDAIDSESLGNVTEQSERIYIIARENGKAC